MVPLRTVVLRGSLFGVALCVLWNICRFAANNLEWHGRGVAKARQDSTVALSLAREWWVSWSAMVSAPADVSAMAGAKGPGPDVLSRLHHHEKRAPLRSWNSSHIRNLFILPVSPTLQPVPDGPWSNVTPPSKSYFAGFEPPNDPLRWNQALLQAVRGEQVLLERVLRVIRSPTDLFENDVHFRWLHRLADLHKSSTKEDRWLHDLGSPGRGGQGHRAHIVMLGYRKFEHPNHEGPLTGIPSMGPGEIIKQPNQFAPASKVVAVGNMDENWGWLSTYFLNRTVPWAMSFTANDNPFSRDFTYPQEQVQRILDNENVIAFFVSQHHNISHPKVLSFPLGLEGSAAREQYAAMMRAGFKGLKKTTLLYSAGSNYAFRPSIRACIAANFPKDDTVFFASTRKVSREQFRQQLASSMASVAMPGLG